MGIDASLDVSSTAVENGDFFIKSYTEKCYQSLNLMTKILSPSVLSAIGIEPKLSVLKELVLVIKLVQETIVKCVDNQSYFNQSCY